MRRIALWSLGVAGGLLSVLLATVGLSAWVAATVSHAQGGSPCCRVRVAPVAADRAGVEVFTELTTGITHAPHDWSETPYLMAFFATWCASCAEEAPTLAELRALGIPVLLLTGSDRPDEARAWASKHAPGVPAGTLHGGAAVLRARQVVTLPTVLLVDPSGTELRRWRGAATLAELEAGWRRAVE